MAVSFGGESMERFIDQKVRPNTQFLEISRRVVDTVVKFFQKAEDLSVDRVIVGGSLGKGTGVKDKSDVDILLVLNGYSEMRSFIHDSKTLISRLESYVKRKFSAALPSGSSYKFEMVTPYSVQFMLKFHPGDSWHEVDVLPIPKGNASAEAFYRAMEEAGYDRPYYAKSLTDFQINFVKPRLAKLKDVVRFFKYWAKTNDVDIISYALELIVIWTWQNKGSPADFSMNEMIKAVAQNISEFDKLKIAWNDNYSSSKYVSRMRVPYVVDPADPFNNVIDGSIYYCFSIKDKGRKLLSSLP